MNHRPPEPGDVSAKGIKERPRKWTAGRTPEHRAKAGLLAEKLVSQGVDWTELHRLSLTASDWQSEVELNPHSVDKKLPAGGRLSLSRLPTMLKKMDLLARHVDRAIACLDSIHADVLKLAQGCDRLERRARSMMNAMSLIEGENRPTITPPAADDWWPFHEVGSELRVQRQGIPDYTNADGTDVFDQDAIVAALRSLRRFASGEMAHVDRRVLEEMAPSLSEYARPNPKQKRSQRTALIRLVSYIFERLTDPGSGAGLYRQEALRQIKTFVDALGQRSVAGGTAEFTVKHLDKMVPRPPGGKKGPRPGFKRSSSPSTDATRSGAAHRNPR